MKRLIALLLTVTVVFFVGCGNGGTGEESVPDRPPAFSILEKQTSLVKHTEKGETAVFSQNEFKELLGEPLSYITVTSLPEVDKGTLIFNGAAVIKGQSLPAEQLEFLKFVPSSECREASFRFSCDSTGYNGLELGCDMVFSDGVNSPPIAVDCELSAVEGISCEGLLSINEPNGDEYTINIITYPSDGFISVGSDGRVVYTPEEGFSGNDSMIYTVTDRFGAVSERAKLSISVEENKNGLVFADMQDDMCHIYAHKMCAEDVMVYRYENGSYYFDPDAPVSKMDFLVMAMCVTKQDADIVAVADSAADDDKGLSSGLKGYLSAAAERGYIRLENGKFSPDSNITYADAAYTVAKVLELPGAGSGSVSAGTSDTSYAAMSAVVKAGLIDTENGVVDVNKELTKSDAAKLLWKIKYYMTKNNMID